MNVGDLVVNIEEPEHGIGIIMQTAVDTWGQPQEPPAVKVLWRNPVWFDLDDGASVMYEDEVEVISESR